MSILKMWYESQGIDEILLREWSTTIGGKEHTYRVYGLRHKDGRISNRRKEEWIDGVLVGKWQL